MSVYGIYGAQLDMYGRVVRAVVRQIDLKTNKWKGLPRVWEVNQIASLIAHGDTVFGIFHSRDSHVKGTVHAPKLKRVVYFSGVVGVDLEENEFGRTVHDLVQHVSPYW